MSISLDKPKEIRLIVFSALLTALHEVMGRDGKNSILRFAGLDQYINQVVPPSIDKTIPFESFKCLINSMNDLLGHGTDAILYESGRKFAIYLSPFGYSLEDVTNKLAIWLGGIWTVKQEEGLTIVRIKNNPLVKSLTIHKSRPSCHVISGALAKIKEESTGEQYIVTEISCEAMGDPYCEFHVRKREV
ncbi:MAG: V4R domain-containing protein [Candidatus Helarchaeota archaeon]